MTVRGVALLVCLASACSKDATNHSGPNTVPHTLVGLKLSPTNPIVELDLNVPGSQVFTVTGHYQDGADEIVTFQVTWSIANPAVGAMSGDTLQIPASATVTAEVSRLTASLGGATAEAQITVVAHRQSGPQQDLLFVLAHQDTAGPTLEPLTFTTAIPALDVFFLMDTTGSMLGEITNLQNALTSTVVPGIQAAVTDSQFGVGALEDFPIDPYGSAPASADCPGAESINDQPFELRLAMTSNLNATQTAVAALRTSTAPIGCGKDWAEAGIEALYQVATGEGLSSPAPTSVPANSTGIGGVGFRAGALPVIVTITDAVTHGIGETDTCPDDAVSSDYAGTVAAVAHSRAQAEAALNAICARVVGVASSQTGWSAGCSGLPYLQDFATASGALVPPSAWDVATRPAGCAAGQCCTGLNGVGRAANGNGLCPLVFSADDNGSGLGGQIVTGIQMLTRFATFDVTSERLGVATDVDGNSLPASHTTADFIMAVTPAGFTLPAPPPTLTDPTFNATTFYGVAPRTQLSFQVSAFNDFVVQTADAQVFRATLRILAGACTPLDERDVLIVVPPLPL